MRMTSILLTVLCGVAVAWAEQPLDKALQDDVLLRALVDENQRSIDGLELKDLARPYFIQYALLDGSGLWVSAEFGAVTRRSDSRSRSLSTDVRVGSYELDNSNFGGGGWGYGGGEGADMPIENDYDAIRQAIWWTTDRDYKNVSETLVQKKAFMESKLMVDKPPDFSHAEPIVHIEDLAPVVLDEKRFTDLAVALSAIFREYPEVKDSGVTVGASTGNKYIVNTEGSRMRTVGALYSVMVSANVQADDGMELSDSFYVTVRDLQDFPTLEELTARCQAMVKQLIAVKDAPRFEEPYTGPVLFDAEPAATLFAQRFAGSFGGGQRPVGSRTSPDDFVNKLNHRILPRFISVVDDPLQERLGDRPLLGAYKYDDECVPAQRVSLVEQGRLKTLLMSRNPSKEFSQSNGHGRGMYSPGATIGTLFVSATPALSEADLRQELLDAAADEGLPYAIRVAELGDSLANPLVVYKVFPDGHEELVRGVEIARFDLKAFKRMLAAGDTPHVTNSADRSGGRTVVAPAMLFEELDLAKIDRDFDKPPILPTPLAR